MENIKFDNLQNLWHVRILMILSAVFILLGVFTPFNSIPPTAYKWMSMLGFLLQILFFSRMLWFKNYVQWNKKGMVIKLNAWIGVGQSIKFDEIKSTNFTANTIEITLFGGRRKRVINMGHIVLEDQQRLCQILQKYIK